MLCDARGYKVCSWVTYLIVSQPTHDERKAAFACLLRAAITCWNIGNFNGAMEITAGLRLVHAHISIYLF